MILFELSIRRLAAAALVLSLTGPTLAERGSDGFHLMSDAEIAAHTAKLQGLQGQAREDYRNTQYGLLVERALAAGYRMPAMPPWQDTGSADQRDTAAAVGSADATAAQTEAATQQRHAAMRERLNAHMAANHQTSMAKEAAAPPPAQDPGAADPGMSGRPPATGSTATHIPADNVGSAPAAVAATPVVPRVTGDPAVADSPTTATPPAQGAVAQPPATGGLAGMPQTPPRPTPPPAPSRPTPPAAPGPYASVAREPAEPTVQARVEPAPTDDYRDAMRSRFEEYMQERQAQMEENVRRQREQYEASMGQNRSQLNRGRPLPPPYPAAPTYGPRYPGAYPGYQTPYWQQP